MDEAIEIFTKETSWNRRGKPPVIRISKSGHIRISVEAARLLGLKQGDGISFMIDNRDKNIVYFYLDNEKGMPLIPCTRGKTGLGLQVCCRPMSQKILSFMKLKDNATFDISKETCKTENGEMWFMQKDKIHKPIKWKNNQLTITGG